MRVDFYLLSQDTPEAALPALAARALAAGERMLVVSADAGQRARASQALWSRGKVSFLANGQAGGVADPAQPILISEDMAAPNGATVLAVLDGQWREAAGAASGGAASGGFARQLLLYDAATIAAARATWRLLGQREGVERHFWRQIDGRWVEGP